MNIPANAERISFRSANSRRPTVVAQLTLQTDFPPVRLASVRTTSAILLDLASRLQLEVESHEDQPAEAGCSYTKSVDDGKTT